MQNIGLIFLAFDFEQGDIVEVTLKVVKRGRTS